MAQGFKDKPPKNPHVSGGNAKKHQTKDMKKGARTIAPKKAAAIAKRNMQKRLTSAHSSAMESKFATQAVSNGKLTIMKPAATEDDKSK